MTLSRTSRRPLRPWAAAASRTAVTLGAAGVLTLLGTGVAAAHVTAQPDTAAKGGYAVVAFRVPSELATAGTVKLVVTLPADHPIASARTEPMAGWKAEVVKQTLPAPVDTNGSRITDAVRTITWTAQPGVRLGPSEFADFTVSLGRLPDDVDELVMPAVQTYDDGTVVTWDQPTPPGGEEPEHPAPSVHLVDAEDGAGDGDGHDHSAMAGMGGHQHGQATGPTAGDRTARWLGGAGLLVGALGLGVGIGALARLRRSRT